MAVACRVLPGTSGRAYINAPRGRLRNHLDCEVALQGILQGRGQEKTGKRKESHIKERMEGYER